MLNYKDINLYQTTREEVSIKIAKRMHAERIRNGYTLEHLAEKMRCTRQTASSWEKGWKQDKKALNRIPHMDQIMELCNLYKCDAAYLLCFYDMRYSSFEVASGITGLTEESIIALNNNQMAIQDSALYKTTMQRFLLSLINYFIPRISELSSSAALYSAYISLADSFKYNRSKEDILEAYKSTDVHLEFSPSLHIPGYEIKGNDKQFFETVFNSVNDPTAEKFLLPSYGFLFILDDQMKKLVESSLENDIVEIVRDFFANYHDSVLHSDEERERVNVNYDLSEQAKRVLSQIKETNNRNHTIDEPAAEEVHSSGEIILDDDDLPF